jgi:hypothetical protein
MSSLKNKWSSALKPVDYHLAEAQWPFQYLSSNHYPTTSFPHGEFKDVPAALYGRYVACVQVLFDLIYGLWTLPCDLQSGPVMTFVDMLVNIFDGLDRGANLDVDVTICRYQMRQDEHDIRIVEH